MAHTSAAVIYDAIEAGKASNINILLPV